MFNLLIFIYVCVCVMFRTIFKPLMCCVLLLVKSLIVSVLLYFFIGLRWFSLIFSMVYFGGIYIVLLFVSAHLQNDQFGSISYRHLFLLFLILVILFGLIINPVYDNLGFMNIVLSLDEEFETYLIYCLCVLCVFSMVSLISGVKKRFIR